MTAYEMVDGVARIHDPELYETWLDDEDFKAAVAADPDPDRAKAKRLLVDFEADLARIVRDDTIAENVVETITRYAATDYIQHDPNAGGDGRNNLIEHFRHVPTGGPTPPPVVSVILDGEIACVMMEALLPDPAEPTKTYAWNIMTVFRVHDGMLAEHWSTFRKMAPGAAPMEM